jgi:hypothetical protein
VAEVAEGYYATYVSSDDVVVTVAAVRYNDAASARPESTAAITRTHSGTYDRMIKGASVIVINAASSTACFKAIDGYLRALQ